MEPFLAGQLVSVATGGPVIDGIVMETPGDRKVVVAVVDERRGPVLRTVHPETLAERSEAGPHDHALAHLIRRRTPPTHGGAAGTTGSVRGRQGHARASSHRTTGK